MNTCEYSASSMNVDSEMTEEYRYWLLRLLAGQAYGELEAARFYTRWVHRAPGLEERRAIAEIIKEEVDHWHIIAKLITDLGIPFEQIHKHQNKRFGHAAIKIASLMSSWTDVVMVALLIDRAAYFGLQDNLRSSYAPWAEVTRDILEEEEKHGDFGTTFTAEQIEKVGKDKIQKGLNKWWRLALNSFGPPNSKNQDTYFRLGFQHQTNEDRRQDFKRDLEPKIAALKLEVPKLRKATFPFM